MNTTTMETITTTAIIMGIVTDTEIAIIAGIMTITEIVTIAADRGNVLRLQRR